MAPTAARPADVWRRNFFWALGWLAATFATLGSLTRPATTAPDEDEIYWIGSAYYYHLAFEQRDWRHPDWKLLPARENPPIAKYVLGLGLALRDQSVTSIELLGTFYLLFERVPGAWGSGAEFAKRSDVVSRMRPELRERLRAGAPLEFNPALLAVARGTIVASMFVTSLLVFLIGARLSGPLAGLIASQLLAVHPAIVHAYNHAHSDIVALLFTSAAVLGAVVVTRRLFVFRPAGFRAPLLYGLGVGVLLGFACGAKMNSLVVVLLIGVAAAIASVVAWRRDPILGRQGVVAATMAFASALASFVVLNPAILGDLRAGLIATVREHQLTEVIQAGFLRDHLVSLPDKLSAVARLSCASALGLLAVTLAALGGLAAKSNGLRFAAVWFLIGMVCVTLWIPFPRGRYVLPVILPGALLLGCLFASAVSRFMISKRLPR